ncbi:MAG: endonuclease/exonuclease/phosphatase family protein [Deinococcus sp.]|nr:endonuclease/exonuclease/phosphatase family protein [Deinococcus sp.]
MTYNVRYDNPEDPFTWDNRQDDVAALIAQTAPDVLGVQEAVSHQVQDLAAGLPGYAYVGQGRGPDNPALKYTKKAGEWNPIFYKTGRLELQDSGTFWLSDTPGNPGSFGPGFSLPRIATWAKFRAPAQGREVLVVNTHFPHEDTAAGQRAYAASVLLRQIEALRGTRPVILTGDFNLDTADSAEAETAQVLRRAFTDMAASTPVPTFYGFEVGGRVGRRLDYIWAAGAASTGSRVLDAHQGDYYLSDHLPVVADITLK